MSFDEQPDGDPHGECAAEIHRLESERDDYKARALSYEAANMEQGKLLNEVIAERDELLAALELVDGHVKLFLGHFKPCHSVYEAVQSAIAKAKS